MEYKNCRAAWNIWRDIAAGSYGSWDKMIQAW